MNLNVSALLTRAILEQRNRGYAAGLVPGLLGIWALLAVAWNIVETHAFSIRTLRLAETPTMLFFFYAWFTYISSLAKSCTPAAVRLVPGLKRSAIRTTIGLLVAMSLLLTGSLFQFLPNAFMQGTIITVAIWLAPLAFASGRAQLVHIAIYLLIACAAGSIIYSLLWFPTNLRRDWIAYYLEWLPITILLWATQLALLGLLRIYPIVAGACIAAFFSSLTVIAEPRSVFYFVARVFRISNSDPSSYLFLVSLTTLLTALTLHGTVGGSADRRQARFKRLHGAGLAPSSQAKAWRSRLDIRSLVVNLHTYCMTRALRQGNSARTRLQFIFGPTLHWTMPSAIYAGFAVLCAFILWLLPEVTSMAATGLSAYVGVVTIAIASHALPNTVYRRAREQALIALVPGSLRGGDWTRWLLTLISRYAVTLWAMGLALISILAWTTGMADGDTVKMQISLLACLPLFLAMAFTRYANARAIDPMENVRPALLMIAAYAAMHWMMLATDSVIAPALALMLTSLVFAVWRARQMLRGPAAIPAGRLASDKAN